MKHKRNGIYHLTVAKFYAEHIKAQMALDGVALALLVMVDATHEVDIDKGLFPAGVVEQIHLQLKTVATVRKAWESEDRFTYQVQSPSEALSTRLEKQGVVLTAEKGEQFVFRRVASRVTLAGDSQCSLLAPQARAPQSAISYRRSVSLSGSHRTWSSAGHTNVAARSTVRYILVYSIVNIIIIIIRTVQC